MYSHLCGFQLNGRPHLWAYRTLDGLVCILEVGVDGAKSPPKCYERWGDSYSHFVSFELNRKPYIWAYRDTTADVVILEIGPDGSSFTGLSDYIWDTGYTGFASCQLAGQVYIWAYRATTSDVVILRIDPTVKAWFVETMAPYKWDTGYTHFASFELEDRSYVWAYRLTSADVAVMEIGPGGGSFTGKSDAKLDTDYTNFTALPLAGEVYIWAYRASTGDITILRVDPTVRSWFIETMAPRKWDTGYTYFGSLGFSPTSRPTTQRNQREHLGGQSMRHVWGFRPCVYTEGADQQFAWRGCDTLCLHEIESGGANFIQRYLGRFYRRAALWDEAEQNLPQVFPHLHGERSCAVAVINETESPLRLLTTETSGGHFSPDAFPAQIVRPHSVAYFGAQSLVDIDVAEPCEARLVYQSDIGFNFEIHYSNPVTGSNTSDTNVDDYTLKPYSARCDNSTGYQNATYRFALSELC